MKTIRILASLLLGTMVFQSHAQQQLTLSDAIKFALQNKADAKKAGLDIANAEHKIAEVKSGALPQVNFNGGITYNPMIQKVATGGNCRSAGNNCDGRFWTKMAIYQYHQFKPTAV